MSMPGDIVTETLYGSSFQYRSGTTDEVVLDPKYIRTRFAPMEDAILPKDGVVLDIGAHIGAISLLAARYVPSGTVHLVEPSLENYILLKRNIANVQGGGTHFVSHKLALGAMNGRARLYHAPGSVGHSFYALKDWVNEPFEPRPMEFGDAIPYEEVEVRTLKSFLSYIGETEIDFMKMNIEGAEYAVLLESSEDTLRAIKCMTVELHPEGEGKAQELIGRLHDIGFTTSFTSTNTPYVEGWVTAKL
jgi:methyltransferase, fkbM family